jgi:hypothetical protein
VSTEASEILPPAHPSVVEADAAYAAGDFRRARALLAALPAGATDDEADRAAVERIRRALSLDPLTWIAVALCGAIWIVLVWRVALS